MTQFVEDFMGYRIEFLHTSYFCAALGLRGFAYESNLKRAMKKEITKRTKAAAKPGPSREWA